STGTRAPECEIQFCGMKFTVWSVRSASQIIWRAVATGSADCDDQVRNTCRCCRYPANSGPDRVTSGDRIVPSTFETHHSPSSTLVGGLPIPVDTPSLTGTSVVVPAFIRSSTERAP